jgi:hypothetical protein
VLEGADTRPKCWLPRLCTKGSSDHWVFAARIVYAVAIASDDEARRAAEATIADVGSGEIERAAEFFSLYSEPRDAHRVWNFMFPMLNEAVGRLRSGDDSPETARLAAFAMDSIEQFEIADAERAAAKAERLARRRAETLMAIQSPPDIAHRMTGVGLHGIPLPDDAVPDGDFLATSHASPAALMSFYIEHMRAAGWTLDLDHSRPLAAAPNCFFTRPDLEGRYVSILTGPGAEVGGPTRLLITEDED